MLGLGGTIGTPPSGITADVLVVTSFDDLKARAAEARGKIVLFDVPFTNYGATVQYRGDRRDRGGEGGRRRVAHPVGDARTRCGRRTPAGCATTRR